MERAEANGATKAPPGHDAAVVTLRVPAEFGCRSVQLVGEFTAWVPVPMGADGDGSFTLMLRLPRERIWRYRFLVDDEVWINDPAADDYAHADDGRAISLLFT
jgi:hypothetical protein